MANYITLSALAWSPACVDRASLDSNSLGKDVALQPGDASIVVFSGIKTLRQVSESLGIQGY